MPNDENKKKKYDLEERTAKFAEEIIDFCKSIKPSVITIPIISQLIKAGTSIGANYCEADCAQSKKESKETKYWLQMMARAVPEVKDESKRLWKEANELNLIFSSIVNKSKNKIK